MARKRSILRTLLLFPLWLIIGCLLTYTYFGAYATISGGSKKQHPRLKAQVPEMGREMSLAETSWPNAYFGMNTMLFTLSPWK